MNAPLDRRCAAGLAGITLVIALLATPAFGESGGDTERTILGYIEVQQQAFAALEAPDDVAVAAHAQRLELAAEIADSRACPAPEAEAWIALGTLHATRGQTHRAETAFRRALSPTSRSGDWEREIRALQGTLDVLLPSSADAEHDRRSKALATYIDVSAVHHRLLDSLEWLAHAQKRHEAPLLPRDDQLIRMAVTGWDYLVQARILGDESMVPRILRAFRAADLDRLAQMFAEEPRDVTAPEETAADWKRQGRWPEEPDGFLDALKEGLGPDGDPMIRLDLMDLAHVDGSHGYVPLFLDLLEFDAPIVRERAGIALGELARAEDLPELLPHLDSEDWSVRRQIALMLAKMASTNEHAAAPLAKRLEAERNGAVRAALLWGLVRSGKGEHLEALGRLMRSKNDRVAAAASVALFDLGFLNPVGVLDKNSQPQVKTKAAEDTAMLLGYASQPTAVHFLERYVDNGAAGPHSHAARSLNRFDTPRARAVRKAQLQPPAANFRYEWPWWGLRDIRRGRWDVDELNTLIGVKLTRGVRERRIQQFETLEWLTGEGAGEVRYVLDADQYPESPAWRKVLRGTEGRKTDGLWSEAGSEIERRLRLWDVQDTNASALQMDLRPRALLVDPTLLTVNLRREQRHSLMSRDWYRKMSIPTDFASEAEDAVKAVFLEGVAGLGEPLHGSGRDRVTFELPSTVTEAALRQADLVVRIQYMSQRRTERFPLGRILRVGREVRADLVPLRLDVEPPTPRPGTHCVVLLDVANEGHVGAPPSEAVVYAMNQTQEAGRRAIGRIRVPSLHPGERVEIALGAEFDTELYLSAYTPGWTPDDLDTAIEVVLDAEDRVEETDEDNNRHLRPVELVLTEAERAARDQDAVLAKLDELTQTIDGFGPDAEPSTVREALEAMLEQLDAVRPRTASLESARRLLQMIGAQAEARDRLRKTIPKVLDFDPATGEDSEAARLLGELLRAQTDLLRSGVPTSAADVAQIQKNLEAYGDAFGRDRDPLDPRQHEALRRAAKSMRLAAATREILGNAPRIKDLGELLGPELDPDERNAAASFLDRNHRWNHEGAALASDVLTQAIGERDRWFDATDMERVRSRWSAWSKAPSETATQVETVSRQNEDSAPGQAADKASRSMLKRLGF